MSVYCRLSVLRDMLVLYTVSIACTGITTSTSTGSIKLVVFTGMIRPDGIRPGIGTDSGNKVADREGRGVQSTPGAGGGIIKYQVPGPGRG